MSVLVAFTCTKTIGVYKVFESRVYLSRERMDFSLCSFKGSRKIACGSSRGFIELVKLSECQADITQHLASCHLRNSGLNESELILARAGYFELSSIQIDAMSICPSHRHGFGRFWRPPRTCHYPGHSGSRKKQCKDRHVINVAMANAVKSIFNVTVEIGSREYFDGSKSLC